ncbi:MAG: hypothetical protein ACI8WB_003982 [Phenylobacterium sp.]
MSLKALTKRAAITTPTLALAMAGLAFTYSANAEDGPAGTDIYLADLSKNTKGHYQLKNVKKITPRKGYDNQPSFLPDGKGLFYTAILPMKSGQWQADSFHYNFTSKKHTNLTNSDLSEYSPTLMANSKRFSAIVVEEDGKQLLWQLPYAPAAKQKKAGRLFDLDPVGYHVWGKQQDLAMFILGPQNTLQYKTTVSAKAKIVAEDIGRSLRYVASRNSFSFSHNHKGKGKNKGKDSWWLSEYQPNDDKVTALVPLPKGSDYYTWLNDETAVAAVKGVLHMWHYQRSASAGEPDWMPWVDLSGTCSTNISRLAVDKNQQRLAFVCDEQ